MKSSNLIVFLVIYACTNLQACPLSDNASSTHCHECDALHYIANTHRGDNINVILNINLGKSINRAFDFSKAITPTDSSYYYEPMRNSSLTSCVSSVESGSACTQHIVTRGSRRPMCGPGNQCDGWNYTCNYSSNRFPQYIWEVQCPPSTSPGIKVQTVYYSMPVLIYTPNGSINTSADCTPFKNLGTLYTWSMQRVPVACTWVAVQ